MQKKTRTEKWNPRRESSKEVENNRLSCILLCNDSPVMMRWAVAAENLLIKANGMLNKQWRQWCILWEDIIYTYTSVTSKQDWLHKFCVRKKASLNSLLTSSDVKIYAFTVIRHEKGSWEYVSAFAVFISSERQNSSAYAPAVIAMLA